MALTLPHAPTLAALGMLTVACGGSPARPPAPAPLPSSTAIVGATLWDGTGRGPVSNAVTVVRGDRIVCAGPAEECPVPKNARVIDARGSS